MPSNLQNGICMQMLMVLNRYHMQTINHSSGVDVVPGAVSGGSWCDDRACGLQRHASTGSCGWLQEHISGGGAAQEGCQDR